MHNIIFKFMKEIKFNEVLLLLKVKEIDKKTIL